MFGKTRFETVAGTWEASEPRAGTPRLLDLKSISYAAPGPHCLAPLHS